MARSQDNSGLWTIPEGNERCSKCGVVLTENHKCAKWKSEGPSWNLRRPRSRKRSSSPPSMSYRNYESRQSDWDNWNTERYSACDNQNFENYSDCDNLNNEKYSDCDDQNIENSEYDTQNIEKYFDNENQNFENKCIGTQTEPSTSPQMSQVSQVSTSVQTEVEVQIEVNENQNLILNLIERMTASRLLLYYLHDLLL